MATYTDFLSGAATVGGTLVGLLFVALSVSPERLRGDTASVEHQAVAVTAFTALVDTLFVSLIGLAYRRWPTLRRGDPRRSRADQ